jgi:spore germination protein
MIIHVVEPGETIEAIANQYGVAVERLILDNDLPNPNNLIVGQSIVIAYPTITYTVQEEDTLKGIADSYQISVMQILRNNPFLSDREFIYPGESLVISYGEKKDKIITNGYANPFINIEILRKTLPYLTYLSIFGYTINENADIAEPDDEELIQMAKEYHVAPIMLVSTLSYQGIGSAEAAYNVLYNEEIVDKYIENILNILRRKGLFGVSFIYTFLTSLQEDAYNSFTEKVTKRLNSEGFSVFISVPPMTKIEANLITFERINYSQIGNQANQIMVMNYSWGHNPGPPMPAASIFMLRLFVDYLITQIPSDKMIIGLPLFGYAWQLPYIIGVTEANALTFESAINLALDTGSEIRFDEISQNPYYEFTVYRAGVPIQYMVWFVDVRSIDALTSLVTEYNFPGIAVWNIMTFFQQMWLFINSQYEIEKILFDSES